MVLATFMSFAIIVFTGLVFSFNTDFVVASQLQNNPAM